MASFLRLVALLIAFGAVVAVPVRCAQTAMAADVAPAIDVTRSNEHLSSIPSESATTPGLPIALQDTETQATAGQDDQTSDPRGCGPEGPPRVSDLPASFESKPTLPGVLLQSDWLQPEPHAAARANSITPALTGTVFTPEAPPPRS